MVLVFSVSSNICVKRLKKQKKEKHFPFVLRKKCEGTAFRFIQKSSRSVLVRKVGQLVFSDIPSAEDAHGGFPLQVGNLVADERGEGGGTRRLDHQPGSVEGGDGRPDLVVAHQDDLLHVEPTQLKGQPACGAEQRRGYDAISNAFAWRLARGFYLVWSRFLVFSWSG